MQRSAILVLLPGWLGQARAFYPAASRDPISRRRNLADIRSGARIGEVVTIDGTHLALVTNPELAAGHIARFVARTA